MNRSVLIVTPFFAPQNHSAVFRAYKLAKYLPQFGWTPVVLTVDTQYEFTEDSALLADLPEEVEVVSARYIEPTLRGIRMALGGRDRTFKATRLEISSHNDCARRNGVSPIQKAYRSLMANCCHAPDAYWTWANTAKTVGKQILKERDIHFVLTTAPPFSSILVGKSLQDAGARWIADFRDPLAYTQRLSSDAPGIYWQQRNIVKSALKNADAVTVAASCFRSIYFDMFGKQGVDPVFIPTGMDEDLLEPIIDDGAHRYPYLIFAGEYLPDYDTAFLEAFADALKHPKVRQTGITLLVVGTLELNRARLMPLIDRFGLHEHVEFLDQRPQREVYKLLSRALAGVLIPGPRAYWWTTFAKMTDYIGMRKPVLAVVPDPSEARTALTHSRLGIFLDGSSEHRAAALTDFLLGKHKLSTPDENECDRYTAHRQVRSFAELLESLAASNQSSAQ
jgi:glycosyltransferase involved in cell wall biosynthesis